MKLVTTSALFVLSILLPAQLAAADPNHPPGYRPLIERHFGSVISHSALDFSKLVEAGPAGQHGFAQVDANGQIVFQHRPGQPVRFLQATTLMMSWWPYTTEEELEAWCDQVQRGGYNLVRTHFLDLMLMLGSTQAGSLNPEKLTLFDRIAVALKKRGIYLYIDITTDGGMFEPRTSPRAPRDPLPALRMYWDEHDRRTWLAGARQLLEHRNPFTGLALRDEPQVIAFQTRNEKGIHFLLGLRGFDNTQYPAFLATAFRAWLKQRYGDLRKLRDAWKSSDGTLPSSLLNATDFDQVGIPAWGVGADFPDFMEFILDSENDLYRWERDQLRAIGVKVPIVDYNVMSSTQSTLARSEMEIVENHSYHDHPIGGPNGYEDVGASLRNDSLLGAAGKDFTAFLGTRLAGRAYFVTEWGVPYWNEFRHENALFAPAYASFQRFSLLGQHGWPVALSSPTPIRVFHLANDPTARAAERVAALLFLRGDVAPARHQASIAMDEKIARIVGLHHGIRSDLLRAGLVTGLSLSPPQPSKPGAVQFTPGRGSALKVVVGASVNEGGGDLAIQAQWSGALRSAGILDSTNRTDIQQLRYESDTHQLFLDARAKTMAIDTPLSVGGVLTAEQRRLDTPRVTVASDGTPLSVCISSLTTLPIERSPRTLVIIATDSRNSGLKTRRDGDRDVMTDKGGAPILLRSFRLELSIQRHDDTPMRAWALREDGLREYEIPVNQTADSVSLIIDTGNPEVPPSSYVEIAIR